MTKTKPVRSLNDIVQFEIPPLFRRQHLNRDVIVGFKGDRGDGKTTGAAAVDIMDYMIAGEPCWSNLNVTASFVISDKTAQCYGFDKGGLANFRSLPLDKNRFLAMDEEYHDGVFFIDEINLWLADARRSMSNQNLFSDDVGQQLRKLKSAIIFTCISEMFVDIRLRDMVDIFVETRDLALSREGLEEKWQPGRQFQWTIYPISRKLTGERYASSRQTLSAVFHGKPFWGAFDTLKRQKREKLIKTPGISATVTLTEDPVVTKARDDWSWLTGLGMEMYRTEEDYIRADDIMALPIVKEKGISQAELSRKLEAFCLIKSVRKSVSENGDGRKETFYKMDWRSPTMLDVRRKELANV